MDPRLNVGNTDIIEQMRTDIWFQVFPPIWFRFYWTHSAVTVTQLLRNVTFGCGGALLCQRKSWRDFGNAGVGPFNRKATFINSRVGRRAALALAGRVRPDGQQHHVALCQRFMCVCVICWTSVQNHRKFNLQQQKLKKLTKTVSINHIYVHL